MYYNNNIIIMYYLLSDYKVCPLCVCIPIGAAAVATPATTVPLPKPPAGILKTKPKKRHIGGMVQWMSWHDSGKEQVFFLIFIFHLLSLLLSVR